MVESDYRGVGICTSEHSSILLEYSSYMFGGGNDTPSWESNMAEVRRQSSFLLWG